MIKSYHFFVFFDQIMSKKSSDPRVSAHLKNTSDLFLQLLSDLASIQEVKLFVKDFFTKSEQQMFAKRLAILLALKEGKSYDQIRKRYGVSSATISSVAEVMSSKGLQLVVQKIETERWADALADRIMRWFRWKSEEVSVKS